MSLVCRSLTGGRGSVAAFRDVDLQADAGEVVALLGPNGAGKTTLLMTLAGLLPAFSGSVTIAGAPLANGKPGLANRAGVVLVPDNRCLFTSLTVEENLRLGAYLFSDERVEKDMNDAFALFPVLKEKRNLSAGDLSGGQQQMLAIARALMGRPSCLLLDEPSMGLAPILVEQILDVVKNLRDLNVTALMVEQNALAALAISDRGYVMETGRIIMSGPSEDLIADERIRQAYLGI